MLLSLNDKKVREDFSIIYIYKPLTALLANVAKCMSNVNKCLWGTRDASNNIRLFIVVFMKFAYKH